jgi:hypothetical protein
MLSRIVSGGQTGVDRAALDAALASGIDHGGWCPRGRRSEEGIIPDHYRLTETPSGRYPQRTAWNVRDSDGTLVLYRGRLEGGTRYTAEYAARIGRPLLLVVMDGSECAEEVALWIRQNNIAVLNVAGPRERSRPGIYFDARRFLEALISADRRSTPAGS